MQWPTNEDRQCNGQQTRTDNTMVNKQGQTMNHKTLQGTLNNLANTNPTKNLTHLKYREITLDRK
jgi:hypothetical protein